MKFNFIIGNPPYQVSDGGAQASAKPVYQYFSQVANDIANVVCLIQPSRWMTGGKGLDAYRYCMLHDNSIKELHDFANSKDVFSNVNIKGGICIYIRDDKYIGDCKCVRYSVDGKTVTMRSLFDDEDDDIFIREPILVNIKRKIQSVDFSTFSDIITSRKPYGLRGDAIQYPNKYDLPDFFDNEQVDGYRVFCLIDGRNRGYKYIPKDYPIPKRDKGLYMYKVFISEAYGCGGIGEYESNLIISKPVKGFRGDLCTETFLQIGPFDTQLETDNCISYIKTKFFRAIVGIVKQTQHTTKKVYKYVPMQDFTSNSDIDWSVSVADIDKQLYKKYMLDESEIEFIETHVTAME